MEHIIQFGVTIDEDKIINTATNKGAEEIIKKVKQEINKYTKGWGETKLDGLFKEEIKKVIEEHKDEIIKNATLELAKNMSRTKAIKEAVGEVIADFQKDGK